MIKDYCFNLNEILMPDIKNNWRELGLTPYKTISRFKVSYYDPHQLLSASPLDDSAIFLSAAFSICLMRSLVTPNFPPISSSV